MRKPRRADALADILLDGPDTPTVTRPPRRSTGLIAAIVLLLLLAVAASVTIVMPDSVVLMVRAFSGR